MAVDCLIGVELNNLHAWVCTFGNVIISFALSSEINKLPLDPVNLAHVVLFFMLFLTNVSNLKNSKSEVIECVNLSSASEGSFIEFHT